ncbi:hypothetical protein L6164_002567 [Bauhinia variegata]|uniref:Uncharacterized protein n=1 Tax=Bauhinia variegata TaxID=167791 RepID=A0ACB9Q029_BAUVA|nr:hypothetical protein L6164_002567 [Bauhinia variegata]
MWRLKIAEGGNDPYLFSRRDFIGRQTWEFDDAGTPEELAQVEEARRNFYQNRHSVRTAADLLWRMQFLREKNFKQNIPPVREGDREEITHETATAALRRATHFYCSLQASDGHWPSGMSGTQYIHPPLVFALYITGYLNNIFSPEHQREYKRYIYNHQCLCVRVHVVSGVEPIIRLYIEGKGLVCTNPPLDKTGALNVLPS